MRQDRLRAPDEAAGSSLDHGAPTVYTLSPMRPLPASTAAALAQTLTIACIAAVSMVTAVTTAGTASAQEADEEAPLTEEEARAEEAHRRYEHSRVLYAAGRYEEAAAELEAAIELDPEAAILYYNLARVLELAGRLEEAAAAYERHIALLPENDPGRDTAAAALHRVQGALNRDTAPPHAIRPPPSRSTRTTPEPRARRTAWACLVAATSLAGGATALSFMAARVDRAEDSGGGDPADQRRRARRLSGAAIATGLAAIGTGTAGVVLLSRDSGPTAHASAWVAPGEAGARLEVRF